MVAIALKARLIFAAAAASVALGAMGQGLDTRKVPRVGDCVGFGDLGHIFTKTFREGLRKRGWEDGRNVEVLSFPEDIFKEGGPVRTCQDYMADKSLDVLVLLHHPDPNPKIPVVTLLWDIGGSGLAKSRTRNITGIAREEGGWEVDAKRMALLKEALGTERVMFLRPVFPADPKLTPGVGPPEELPVELREAARKLGITIAPVNVMKAEDLESAFNAMASKPRTAAILPDSPTWGRIGRKTLYSLQLKHDRLPVMRTKADWVVANPLVPGLEYLIAYGTSYLDEMDRFAYFVDRILRGAKPADLPFEQTPQRLAVNVDAAKKLGITFPASILTAADFVVPPHPRFDWTTTPQPESKLESPSPKR